MTGRVVARERLLAAALSYVATRLHQEAQDTPGAYDDAQSELDEEILDRAVVNYAIELDFEETRGD